MEKEDTAIVVCNSWNSLGVPGYLSKCDKCKTEIWISRTTIGATKHHSKVNYYCLGCCIPTKEEVISAINNMTKEQRMELKNKLGK